MSLWYLDSQITLEPVTGKIWHRRMMFQWNVGIPKDMITANGRLVASADTPLPVFWVERNDVLSGQSVRDHIYKVGVQDVRYHIDKVDLFSRMSFIGSSTCT